MSWCSRSETAEDFPFGIGTHQLTGSALPFEPGIQLFHFGSAPEGP